MKLLCGDLGGTKVNLAIHSWDGDESHLVREQTFPSRDHGSLEEILRAFMAEGGETLAAAAMGVAGPCFQGRSKLVNLDWPELVEEELGAILGGVPFRLMNDLVATAWGIPELPPEQFVYLQGSHPPPPASAVVLAPGTGLGVALMPWTGSEPMPVATEAGHTDLAVQDPEDLRLLEFLRRGGARVCWEDVLCGPGLGSLYAFCLEEEGAEEHPEVTAAREGGDPNAAVARLAIEVGHPVCSRALDIFVRLLGSEAGNWALRTVAHGGVFLAGGIPPKILSALRSPAFVEAFRHKAHHRPLLESFPVAVVLEPRTALIGGLAVARRLAAGS